MNKKAIAALAVLVALALVGANRYFVTVNRNCDILTIERASGLATCDGEEITLFRTASVKWSELGPNRPNRLMLIGFTKPTPMPPTPTPALDITPPQFIEVAVSVQACKVHVTGTYTDPWQTVRSDWFCDPADSWCEAGSWRTDIDPVQHNVAIWGMGGFMQDVAGWQDIPVAVPGSHWIEYRVWDRANHHATLLANFEVPQECAPPR